MSEVEEKTKNGKAKYFKIIGAKNGVSGIKDFFKKIKPIRNEITIDIRVSIEDTSLNVFIRIKVVKLFKRKKAKIIISSEVYFSLSKHFTTIRFKFLYRNCNIIINIIF